MTLLWIRRFASSVPKHSLSSLSSLSSSLSSSLPKLRIVALNDVYELDQLPYVQTLIAQCQPQLVILAGDFLSPSTLSSMDGGRGMIATLRSIGLTHLCLGNHEADLTSLTKLHRRYSIVILPGDHCRPTVVRVITVMMIVMMMMMMIVTTSYDDDSTFNNNCYKHRRGYGDNPTTPPPPHTSNHHYHHHQYHRHHHHCSCPITPL